MEGQNKNILKIPQFPQKLPGSFWGITTFFNPEHYKNKIQNYIIFREKSKKQGLKLLTVELAFENQPFELEGKDADILIQARSNSVLWQKERLFNIGVKNLPRDCDKVALIDADIMFKNNNWIKETSDLLKKYKVIQPFESAARMDKKNKTETQIHGIVYGILNNRPSIYHYEFGYAWAIRKEVLDKVGVYDRMIIGSGDTVLALSIYGRKNYLEEFFQYKKIGGYLKNDILNWREKIYAQVRQSMSYTKGTILHLYHGGVNNRLYPFTYHKNYVRDFNPNKDIRVNKYGCWEWATQKPELHQFIKEYFKLRNEEGQINIINNLLVYKKFPKKIFYDIDRQIGKAGILLKKRTPRLYYLLKSIKNRFGLWQ